MAEVNRYSQITPAKFNPLDLREIMLVPQMQRQKHDQLLAQQEILRQGLAKVDPLDVHMDEAMKLKSDLNNQITSQAEELAREGINPNSTSNFIRLNRQYNDLISPTGRLGQINAAKPAYLEAQKNYLEDAVKKGFSNEAALKNWQDFSKQYTGYGAKNDIAKIGNLGAPNYRKLDEDLKNVSSMLGEETKTIMKNNGYYFEPSPDGGQILVKKDGNVVDTTNIPNLNQASQYLSNIWLNPQGEGFKSAMHNRESIDNVASQINSGLGIMKETKRLDTRGTDYQYIAPKEADVVDPTGIIISNDSTLQSNATEHKSFQDAQNVIQQLSTSKSLNPADRAKLDDLQELKAQAEVKMLKDPSYNQVLQEYNTAKKNLPEFKREIGKYDVNYATKKAQLDRAESKLNSIKDKYWKESSSVRHNYSYLPSNPKEESAWNLHNENVFNTLNGVGDLGNVLDLTSIHTTGGTKKNVNQEDVKNIQDLLKSGDPKSFKINNIKTYGDNKTPEITMTFNTKQGAKEYDMQGLAWNDEYGGEEKPVTVTFKLKKLSNSPDTGSAPGFKNLTGAIAGFWKDKGSQNDITGNHQGNEVYNSLIENAYGEVSNEELYARAQTDSDAREALMIRVAKRKNK